MGFYRERIVPHLVNLAMRQGELVPYRRRTIAGAEGRVLEIGFGSGLNVRFYGSGVNEVIGLEPSAKLRSMAQASVDTTDRKIKIIDGSADAISLDDRSVDTVVSTWTLCTIPDVNRALREVRRVLKPEGQLLFVEHGRSPDSGVQRWQDRLNPLWKPIAGGCHLNRPIADLITDAGFRLDKVDTGYGKGPKPMVFMYEGVARPR